MIPPPRQIVIKLIAILLTAIPDPSLRAPAPLSTLSETELAQYSVPTSRRNYATSIILLSIKRGLRKELRKIYLFRSPNRKR